jgi:hypothetical protein
MGGRTNKHITSGVASIQITQVLLRQTFFGTGPVWHKSIPVWFGLDWQTDGLDGF